MNSDQILKIVEQFSRKSGTGFGVTTVTRIPDYKTVYVEQIGEIGRSMILSEYQVDGKTYWAGYSPMSDTVFVSQASRSA